MIKAHRESGLSRSATSERRSAATDQPTTLVIMPTYDHIESLRAAERRLQAAQLTSDVDVLGELIDDVARFTGPDGNVYSKQDDLRAHATGYQVLSRVEEEDLQVLATAHTGVTWFLGTLEGTVGGQPLVARMRYTRTWIHDDQSGWKIIAAHAMFLTDGATATGE
jgi:ketosteroid isomerase-like protein